VRRSAEKCGEVRRSVEEKRRRSGGEAEEKRRRSGGEAEEKRRRSGGEAEEKRRKLRRTQRESEVCSCDDKELRG
jgi:hypothetical protein